MTILFVVETLHLHQICFLYLINDIIVDDIIKIDETEE